MEKVIVTGGAGFIGSHLAARLTKEGFLVSVFDNLATANPVNVPAGVDFINGSVSDENDIKRLPMKNVAAVFHLAGQSSGEASFNDPCRDLDVNIGGTLRVLEWCRRNNIKRFVFSSSMAVYGKTSERPIAEDSDCNPQSFYGVAKLSAEHYINFYQQLGLEPTILRLFNVYGSRQNLDNLKQGMASIYLSYILRKHPVIIKGSVERFRDQTHVSDVVEAMMLCIEKPVSIGKTFNIATGTKTTVRNLIDVLLKVSGNAQDYPCEMHDGTQGDIFGCYADVSKAERELGWLPKTGLEAGLSEMYNYYVESNDRV